MGLLKWLWGTKSVVPEVVGEQNRQITDLPEIKEEEFVDNSDPKGTDNLLDGTTYQVSYGTGFPIDVIYGFINRDFEQKGFDDAMVNSDISYKNSGKLLIVNELKALFQQVTLRYQRDRMVIDVMIENLEGQGLPLQVKSLRMRQQLLDTHVREIEQMKVDLDHGEERVMRMVITYERGFLKGLAAKSDAILNINSQKVQTDGEIQ